MRLRAYLLHRFKSKQFNTAPVLLNGKSILKYTIVVKEIKKNKDGENKLDSKPTKKPVKKPNKAKKRTRIIAALARVRTYHQNLTA